MLGGVTKIVSVTALGWTLVGASGCISSESNVPNPTVGNGVDAASPNPPETTDGSVGVDGAGPVDTGVDVAPPIVLDAGPDATRPTVFSGGGSGVVAHSAHFTLLTKTGNEPGGAGVKSSKSYTVVSGVAPK